MKKLAISWIYYADNDINTANKLVKIGGSRGQVAVFCQQAIEKYFKGHLAEHGREIRKTHDLLSLYKEIENIESWNLDKDLLGDINDIYIDYRYPGDIGITPNGEMPTTEETRSYLEFAQEVEAIFKRLYIKTVDDVKEIIRQNYAIELTSQDIASINKMVNDDKMEIYQAYNKIIEEINENS